MDQASAPFRRSSAVRFLAATTICLVAITVLAACGGGDDERTNVIPADATFAVTLNLEDGDKGAWKEAQRTLRRIPATRLAEDSLPSRDSLVDMMIGDDVNYAKDVAPWIGDEAGFAGNVDGLDNLGQTVLVWMAVSDNDAAERFLTKKLGSVAETEYQDIVLHESRDGTHHATLDEIALVSGSVDYLKQSIRASKGKALESTDEWTTLHKQRKGNDPLLSIFVTADFWDEFVGLLSDVPDVAKTDLGTIEILTESGPSMGMHVGADAGDGLWFEVASLLDGREPPKISDASARELLNGAPSATLAGVASRSAAVPTLKTVEQSETANKALTKTGSPFATAWRVLLANSPRAEDLKLFEEAFTGATVSALVRDGGGRVEVFTEHEVASQDEAFSVVRAMVNRTATSAGTRPSLRHTMAAVETANESLVGRVPFNSPAREFEPLAPVLAQVLQTSTGEIARHPIVVGWTGVLAVHYETEDDEARWWVGKDEGSPLGDETLESIDSYREALRAANPPRSVDMLGWVDLHGLAQQVLVPLDKTSAFVADQQLEHSGGIVLWSTSRDVEGDKRDLVRFVAEFPLYE